VDSGQCGPGILLPCFKGCGISVNNSVLHNTFLKPIPVINNYPSNSCLLSTIHCPLPTILHTITITNAQTQMPIDKKRLRKAVRLILADESITGAKIGVAVVDDPAIAALNRRYLDDPLPTDVLSFALEKSPGYLEGEIVVSADTALASAENYHWPPGDELLLYVIHGALHLVGYDDAGSKNREKMRKKEREYLARFGLVRK
jgi:probable rRNA maturation factor